MKPRARKQGLVVTELPDELLVYDLERHKAHCLNPTAALVFKHCDGRRTVEQIARSLSTELDVAADERLVWLSLDRLAQGQPAGGAADATARGRALLAPRAGAPCGPGRGHAPGRRHGPGAHPRRGRRDGLCLR